MSDVAIRVENLGKQYRIGGPQAQYKTIRESLAGTVQAPFRRLASAIRGQPSGASNETIWALKDVSFEVKRGEVVGVIGRNGAGKTTLLKILSRITEPTDGGADIHGRVGSLLEVGTGFHPELTGRENIFLSGAILGMKKHEIERKFDEIVDFAEIEKFMDTPVKRYSSGMYVRLAFAVAAHLDPEILLVDEVLAVGDAQFQKKCLGKMGKVAEGGRTVLFVSHNMTAVEHLCSRAVLLSNGQLIADDSASRTVSEYLRMADNHVHDGLAYGVRRDVLESCYHPDFRFTDILLSTPSGALLKSFRTGDPLRVRVKYEAKRQFISPAFAISLKSNLGQEVLRLNTSPISRYPIIQLGSQGFSDLVIESLPLTAGRYYLDVGLIRQRVGWIVKLEDVVILDVSEKDVYGSGMALDNSKGLLVVSHYWEHHS